MKEITLDSIEKDNLLIYKYIRGSFAYGLNVETSDKDTSGIFCIPEEYLIGTRHSYVDQVSDLKQDNTLYELEKFIKLLTNSNPNVLESLFIPENCIIYKHPAMDLILANRDMFVTKKCFQSFFSYGRSQVHKAKSLHKLINIDKPEKKTILDFCYTPYKQGSTNIQNWLSYRNMKDDYIGCVNIPNMTNALSLFYDWGEHIRSNETSFAVKMLEAAWACKDQLINDPDTIPLLVKRIKNLDQDPTEQNDNVLRSVLRYNLNTYRQCNLLMFINEHYHLNDDFDAICKWINEQRSIYRYYRGMITYNQQGEISNELRLSSVLESEIPICYITCNTNGYSESCKKYKQYIEWEKMRNPVRYESNLHKSYDAKNMMHCFRLIKMCIEIAQGKGFNLDRRNIDREFLLDIRNHKYEYDELIKMLDELTQEMEAAVKQSNLPDDIDPERMEQLCIDVRKVFWNSKKYFRII